MSKIVVLEDVWKIYGSGEAKVIALRGVNLEIEEKDFIAIVGPSGSGKSTLLHIIGGLDRPSKGRVIVGGFEISSLTGDVKLSFFRNRFIGFVFQIFYLIPRLTVLQNVELPLIARGVPKKERRRLALEAIKMVGLEKKVNSRSYQLSGGEQQRVAIARAIVGKPKLLLADEPTGNLDTANSKIIMELFTRLNRELGVTVILVTHNLGLISYCNKAVRLLDGKIVRTYGKSEYDKLIATFKI